MPVKRSAGDSSLSLEEPKRRGAFSSRGALALLLLISSCARGRVAPPTPPSSPAASVAPSVSPLPAVTVQPSQPGPTAIRGFSGSVSAVARERLTSSWRPGCPVPVEDLRLLRVVHLGFDGAVHDGELVVHHDQAAKIMAVLEKIYEARFPIERMRLVDVYGADDDRSMEANNTSAFNCREVEGRPGVWSQHSYGRAIDINPIQNPYVSSSGEVSPAAGAAFKDRASRRSGMIVGGDAVVDAFSSVGWRWGGYWKSSKDYQHFSSNGR